VKKYILFVGIVALFVSFFSSCGDVEKNIVGVWKIEAAELTNFEEIVNIIGTELGLDDDDFEKMKAEMNESLNLVGATFNFKENKKIIFDDGSKGDWSYNSNTIFIILADGDKFSLVTGKIKNQKLEGILFFTDNDSGVEYEISLKMTK
jgi:Lipocalin-like domain